MGMDGLNHIRHQKRNRGIERSRTALSPFDLLSDFDLFEVTEQFGN